MAEIVRAPWKRAYGECSLSDPSAWMTQGAYLGEIIPLLEEVMVLGAEKVQPRLAVMLT